MRGYDQSFSRIRPFFQRIAKFALLAALSSGFWGCSTSGTSCTGDGGSCPNCAASQVDCNGDPSDGCETNLMVDPMHCGSCDKRCPGVTTQSALCRNGICDTCPSSRLDCNGVGVDGCETKVNSDPKNCGKCGSVCPAVVNGVAGCLNGACVIDRCNPGFSDCNGDPTDGCETNTLTDDKNCGSCNSPCPALAGGPVSCQQGSCVVGMCRAGFASCNPNSPVQACETDLRSDVYNCSACGLVCPATGPATSRACVMMSCTSIPCAAPWKDCNAVAGDGCEIDTSRDLNNCGACGTKCTGLLNATSACVSSQCILTSCSANFGDCNLKVSDGCESNLLTDPNHCGSCTVACMKTPNSSVVSCQMGQCNVDACNIGFLDCDNLYNNGCEANINSDVFNCGACDNVCVPKPHVQPLCKNMACVASGVCDSGYMDCDANAANGCEADIKNDPSNCGGCKVKCPAGKICAAGKCA